MPEKGYRTVAIHGYKSRMFQRSDWYPQIGFERSYFLEDLKSMAAMHICEGAFSGICDADIAGEIHRQLPAQV